MKRPSEPQAVSLSSKKRKLDKHLYTQFSNPSSQRYLDLLNKTSTDAGYISVQCVVKYPQRASYFQFSATTLLSTTANQFLHVVFRGKWVDAVRIEKPFTPKQNVRISLRGCLVCEIKGVQSLVYEEGVCFALLEEPGGGEVYDTWALPDDSQEGDEWMQSPTLRNVAQLDGYVEIDQPSSPPIQEQTPSSLPFFKHSQPDEEDEAPLVSPGIDEQDNEWFFTQASTRSPIVEPIRLQPSRLLRVGEELELPRRRVPPPSPELKQSPDERSREFAAGSLPTPKSTPAPPEHRSPMSTYPTSIILDDLPSSFIHKLDDDEPAESAEPVPLDEQQEGNAELTRKQRKHRREKEKKSAKRAAKLAERGAGGTDGNVGDALTRGAAPGGTGVNGGGTGVSGGGAGVNGRSSVENGAQGLRGGQVPATGAIPVSRQASATNAVAGPSRVEGHSGAESHTPAQAVASAPTPMLTNPRTVVQIQRPGAATVGSGAGGYTSFGDLKGFGFCDVVGLVMSVGKQEPRHDSVRIRVDLTDPTATKHHAVFCYETTYFEWLPQVIPGDVLVLRNVQAGKYGNLNGRERRYRWTAYDPTTAQFKVPIWGTAPKEENGFSPFYESPPSEGTIRKCEEIANWALTRLDSGTNAETRNSAANAVAPSSRILHDLGALNTSLPGISGRKHLLLDEASGYFDCTVEIVGGGPGYGCYNLSVVDYTIPRGVYPNANREIPEAKRQYVLTIECSREAESPAVKLKVGSVYRIENVLAKTRKGYVQGSAIDNKFKELDVRAEPRDKALDALLRRKAELRFASAPSIREFDHRSLKNIDKEGHTTLIVEMVHGEPAPNDGNFYFIFVTDFTYNQPDLPHLDLLFNSPKPRSSHRLEHRILKIRLDNGQQQYGPEMQVGKAYRIVNASVRRNKKWIRGEFVATLGGAANLIHPLDEGSEEWKALQESKDRWRGVEPVQDLVDVEPEAPDFDLAKVPKKSFRPEGVAVAEWPPVCTMLARVVSMKPGYLHLEDCSPLYCSKCSYPLPKRDDSGKKYSTKKCPTCKVECTKRMLSFHVTVEEITSGLRFPVYVGISEEQTKLPLLQKLKQVTGSAKPGNLSVEFYHSLFERFMQRMVGDEESREAGESFLKHCAWMVYTVAKYDTTSVALCDYEKP